MKIVLKDGTEYEGAANSTATEFIVFVSDIDAFAAEYKKMTNENLSALTVGDTTVINRTLHEAKVYTINGQVEAHFVVLPTTEQVIIDEMGARVALNADKAQAYDILMGGAT